MGFLDNLDNCDSINRFLARVETDNDRPEDIESGSPKTTGIPYSTDLLQILTRAIQQEASDVHLIAGYPPTLRVHGKIIPLDDNACMNPEDIMVIFQSITTKEQRVSFWRDHEIDFFYDMPGLARTRTNACIQQGTVSILFRIIPMKIPAMEDLGLPKVCKKLTMETNGLILVTGPTGAGKTTTMASMVNYINQNSSRKIVTIEDPIEYIYRGGQSIIIQRNLGDDTNSFAEGVKRALRQDPDVILIGEMRDLETMSAALTAAVTGHLVTATLHTMGAAKTIDRIIDVFPSNQTPQIRLQMSLMLKAVISQILLPKTNGKGRVAAFEVMIGTSAIRSLIREGKTHQIDSILETSSSCGMYTLAQELGRLAKANLIRTDLAETIAGKSLNFIR